MGVDSLSQLGELIQLILSIPEIEGVITDDGANSFYELHKSNEVVIWVISICPIHQVE